MIIDTVNIAITEKELNIAIGKFLPKGLPLSQLRLELVDNCIKITGNAEKVVKVPFVVWIKLLLKKPTKIEAKIVKIEAVGPVGNMLRSLILNVIVKMLPEKFGIRSFRNSIKIYINKILSIKDARPNVKVNEINIEKGILKVSLSGNIDPPEAWEAFLGYLDDEIPQS